MPEPHPAQAAVPPPPTLDLPSPPRPARAGLSGLGLVSAALGCAGLTLLAAALGALAGPAMPAVASLQPMQPMLAGVAVLGVLALLAAPLIWRRRMAPAATAAGSTTPADRIALAALRRSDQQLRQAEQLAHLGSFDWNPVSGALHWSDEHCRLWGFEPGAVTPSYDVFRAGVHPDDVGSLELQLQHALLGGRVYDCTHRVRWADGTVRDIHARGEVAFDDAGQACRMIGTVQDITERVQARTELAASVENLRRTLNATGDAIFASDARNPQERVLFVNDQMLQMWGIPPDAAATLTPADIIRHARPFFMDPDAEVRRIAQIIASDEPAEERIHLRDGRVLVRRCVPTRDEGRSVRVWGFRDITAEARALQALSASEAEQRALLDVFPGYIAALDADLRYTYVNTGLAALLGTVPERMTGRVLGEAEGTVRNAETEAAVRRALAGEVVVTERHLPATPFRPDTTLLVTLAPGLNDGGGEPMCYTFGIDITELKGTEKALLAAKNEAERANRAKSQFLSSMSHELRTPMNSVLGFGQLLELDAQLSERQHGYVREILRGGRHLLNLINDLLDLARIEAGRMAISLEPVDVTELMDECLSLVRPLAEARSIHLPLPADRRRSTYVMADRIRLKQVLLNLLGNAIKYNREGGHVGLDCAAQGDLVRIAVRDTGRGLDPASCERLFQPFERLGADSTLVEGAGIGLALSRRLVTLMQGHIGVDSEPGVGSTFWVDLAPGSVARTTGYGTRPDLLSTLAPIADGAQRTVLYIEDNPVNIVLMEAMLERLPGVRLLTATHPHIGLEMAREQRPDLVLLDIQMPDMDGFEVLDRLRSSAATARIPVIAVSANAMSLDVERGLSAGFVNYLTKPLDLPVLLAAVAEVLQGGRTRS